MENTLESTSLILQKGPSEEIKMLRALEPVAAFQRRGIPVRMNASSAPEKDMRLTNLTPLANLYARVFAGPPWFEVGRCKECGTFYTEKGGICTNDNAIIGEAYPLEDTLQYIRKEWSKPGAFVVLTRLSSGEIINFAWGYQLTIGGFLQSKYPQGANDIAELRQILTKEIGCDTNDSVYYISEVGTSPEYRGNGLAYRSLQKMLEFARSQNFPVLLRTNTERPSMYGIAKRLGMKQITGPIRDSDEVVNIQDSVNPDRVIFIAQPRFV